METPTSTHAIINKRKPKIAVVASRGLGDGLLFLVIANNLQKNGYEVTFYNNFIAQLQSWIPDFKVKAYPQPQQITQEFSQYDLVLSERVSIITDAFPPENHPDLGKKYVFISCVRHGFHQNLIYNQSNELTAKISDHDLLNKLLPIAQASGTMLPDISNTLPLSDTLEIFCRQKLRLTKTNKECGLKPPPSLSHRKHQKRIVIHPTSSSLSKNWAPRKFIKLARSLKQLGWEPVFTVSPSERGEWLDRVANEFPVPEFATIADLAAFIYQSAMMLGNESGIGHLASALQIPTLSIAGTATKKLRWRPSWSYGELIIFPKIKLGKKKYWQCFISVHRVLRRFKKFAKTAQQRS